MRWPVAVSLSFSLIVGSALACRFKEVSDELTLARVMAVSFMAENFCTSVEPDDAVKDSTIKALEYKSEISSQKRFASDLNEYIALYRDDIKGACRSFEFHFGPKGDLVRGLVRPRRSKTPLAGKYSADSPESEAAFVIATTAFVAHHCSEMTVDNDARAKLMSAIGVERRILMSDELKPDIELLLRVYRANPEGCRLAWQHLGPAGDLASIIVSRKAH